MGKNYNYHSSKGSVRTPHNAKESLKNTGKK